MKDDSLDPATEPEGDESGAKVYASLASLATEDGTMPEIGDEVEFSVQGTVKSIDGDAACVSPTMVNGQPAPQMPMQDKPEDMHDKLMREASSYDEMM